MFAENFGYSFKNKVNK